MDKQDIFDFDFVDRTEQYLKLIQFIEDNKNYLCINGESGVGKTFLIKKKLLKEIDSKDIIYINLSPEVEKNNCINELLINLQKFSEINFPQFLKDNFSSILEIGKKTLFELIKLKEPSLDWFCDILCDSNIMFIRNENEKIPSLKIVEMFIDKILKQRRLYIVLDNFTFCDKKSLSLLSQLFYHYRDNERFKCIFVTTSNTLEEREDIGKLIADQLQASVIKLNPLDNEKYFYIILESIFDIEPIRTMISDIYNICKGNPETLKTLLRKVLLEEGIKNSSSECSKYNIDRQKLHQILYDKVLDLSLTDFSENECFIIQIILCFGNSALLTVFQDCVYYIQHKIFGGEFLSKLEINKIVYKLNSKNIIKQEGFPKTYIKFTHDKTFFSIRFLFKNYINNSMISNYFYEFLLENEDNILNYDMDIDYLKAHHSYIAQRATWVEDNYLYAYKCFIQGKFYDSIPMFKKILNKDNASFDISQFITMAQAFYETGDYHNSKLILLSNKPGQEERLENLFHYFLLFGKVENILLHKSNAIYYYGEAIKYASNREEEILVLHLKHLALLETPSGKEEARDIFNSIVLNLTEDEKKMLPVCYLLRNCNQFYTGEKADEFFNLALKIAVNYGTKIDEAYVHNNYALELFRTYYLDKAYSHFKDAYEILSEIKFHESTYPLNNMAVYEIFNKNYNKAIDYLNEAKYTNHSIYAGLAIKVHLMTCYRLTGEEEYCRKYMYELETYLNNEDISDLNIIRKLSINLCISYLYYGEKELAKKYLNRCLDHVKGTISEYRGYTLYNQLVRDVLDSSSALKSNPYYTILDFEPWVITLSHD